MSMRTSGLARRSFIIGSRLWPPARSRASGPCRSSSAKASSTLPARSYSNGAGVCMFPLRCMHGAGGGTGPTIRVRPAGGAVHRRLSERLSAYGACVTLTQLEAFVLVARLGSVKAAAQVLGVSEPAVSGALAALRQHLGDSLVVRTPAGMELTPGGQRLAPIASQMVNLAVEAEGAIRHAQGAPELLRVVATSTVAESVARPLVTAFTARHGPVEATLGVTTATEMPALLHERLADVGLGPRLSDLDARPMMRYRLVVVAGPRHPLAGAARVGLASLAHQDWLVDASGADSASDIGRLLARLRVPDARIRVFPGLAAAWTAAAEGDGVAPGVAHLVAGGG